MKTLRNVHRNSDVHPYTHKCSTQHMIALHNVRMHKISQPRTDLCFRMHDCNDQPSFSPEGLEPTIENKAIEDMLV